MIYDDLQAYGIQKKSFKKLLSTYFTHPAFKIVASYRLYAHWYKAGGLKKGIAKYLWLRAVKNSGCYISPKAQIGKGLWLPHATGIVIGDGAVIGENVTIYQNVTIGQKGESDVYPTVMNGVTVYAGACIIGNITLGENVTVGANAVVLSDVPDNTVVAGIPAKNIKK